jgi:hypothetical protein
MEPEFKRVPLVCQHCGYENSFGFTVGAHSRHIRTCWRCDKWTWVIVEGDVVKACKAYSKCPRKCKIGKLEPEVIRKIDVMLMQGGLTYQGIIELYPPAGHLNGANLSTHNNKHIHPDFRASRSVATEEHWLENDERRKGVDQRTT